MKDATDIYLAEVIAVRPLKGFAVDVTFSDGTQRRIDLEPYLHGHVFDAIRNDRKLFRAVRVQDGTIGWQNGADIDPDTLFYEGNPPWTTASSGRSVLSDEAHKRRRHSKARA